MRFPGPLLTGSTRQHTAAISFPECHAEVACVRMCMCLWARACVGVGVSRGFTIYDVCLGEAR